MHDNPEDATAAPIVHLDFPGGSSATAKEQSPALVPVSLHGPVVLILVGLVASGKSTFAEALSLHFPQYVRCNQDDLGDRRMVERIARQSLAAGNSVCIDRTNFDASQRAHWINIAREFRETKIWVIVFDTPFSVCVERLQTRVSHPTIHSPEQGVDILTRFASQLKLPQPYEGYQRILHLSPSETSSAYTRSEIEVILERIQQSPEVIKTAAPMHSPGVSRGYRGGGYNRGGAQSTPGGYYSSRGGQHSMRGSPHHARGSQYPPRGSQYPLRDDRYPSEDGDSYRSGSNNRGRARGFRSTGDTQRSNSEGQSPTSQHGNDTGIANWRSSAPAIERRSRAWAPASKANTTPSEPPPPNWQSNKRRTYVLGCADLDSVQDCLRGPFQSIIHADP